MTLYSLLVDQERLIPIEIFLIGLQPHHRPIAFRMLQQGRLQAQGRTLLMDNNSLQSGFGCVFEIPVESWLDADMPSWEYILSRDKPFQLQGHHPEDVIVEVKLHNTEKLREFAGFEAPSISVDEYDERFFRYTSTKMGAKVWARAAAALASEKAEPTGRKLTAYLLAQDDLWPNGELSEDLLRRHLSPFISEFKRLDTLN